MPLWKKMTLSAAVLVIFYFAQPLRADSPSYLLLRTPAPSTPHQPSHGYYSGRGYAVETPSYAYGWFGAKPRTHASRHFGYYRDYTQWSWK